MPSDFQVIIPRLLSRYFVIVRYLSRINTHAYMTLTNIISFLLYGAPERDYSCTCIQILRLVD